MMMEMADLPLDGGDHENDEEQALNGSNDDASKNQNIDKQRLKTQVPTAAPSDDEGSSESDDEEEQGRRSLLESQIDNGNDSQMQPFDIEDLRSEYRSSSQKRQRNRQEEEEEQSLMTRIWKGHWFGGPCNDDDDDDDDDNESWTWRRRRNDGEEQSILLLEPSGVKFFKFAFISIGCLLFVHFYVQIVGDKRDTTYGLKEMILYDGNLIALDLMVLFVVGRFYEQASVDTCEFVFPTLLSAILQSFLATNVSSLQHSVTPSELKCEWTWQMWALIALGVLPLLLTITGAHVVASIRLGIGMRKLIEAFATVVVFVLPYTIHSTFLHLHHWYTGWLVAMHCNIDVWWSRLCRAVLFGVYVNGVAIFGRDPIMTCAITLYQSQNQECAYISENYENYTLAELAHDSGLDFAAEGGCNAGG